MYYDLTLGELLNSSFDLACDVEIYDCTHDYDTDNLYWNEGGRLVVSSYNCSASDVEAVDPELLNGKIQYVTVSGKCVLIIEVVK